MKVAIYGGQVFSDKQNFGQTGAIVVHLMSEFLNKGYHLFTDNWYNSVSLMEFLSQKKTYVTGTLRADRKGNPKKVMSAKLKKGEMKWMSLDDITVTKWKDRRDVHVISNAHKPEMVPVANRHRKTKTKHRTRLQQWNVWY